MSSNPKDTFSWVDPKVRYPGAPPYVVGLPKGEGMSPFKIFIFDFTALISVLSLILAQLFHIFGFLSRTKIEFKGVADLGLGAALAPADKWEKLQDLSQFFKPWTLLPKPLIADRWEEDAEFGNQFLGGLNPVLMRKANPEDLATDGNFPVTDDHLKPYLGDNFSLASAFEKGKLYLLDYQIFGDIIEPKQEDQLGRYTASPLCLFYLNEQEQLLPVAIKVKQKYQPETDPYPEILTPKSSPVEWKAAKLAVAATDIAYQGIIAHLLDTHLVIEVCTVSTYRILSPDHILYQLLKPHFFNTLAINYMARSTFLGRGNFFDSTGALGYTGSNELLSRAYWGKGLVTDYEGEPWEFYKKALPYSLESRGVVNLPNYHYKDDALLMWDATKKYVSDVLKNHYKDNNAVESDDKLQAWKNELIAPNAGTIQGLLPPEKADQLTGKLNNLDDLIEIVTIMIFLATTQHAAVNFGQYDYGAWVSNMPFALYKPFSSLYDDEIKTEEDREKILLDWLPDRQQTIKQIVLVKILTILPPYTSKSLLTLPNPFQEDGDKQAFKAFKKQLKEIEVKLKERNNKLKQQGKTPYVYLQPSHIPQSIAI
ncbi:lipoxygenase family protein [Crocosphaera sp. UHCC 0190]|uniref:lipoxygenase family protein n=1 Tax=Crocosphaera sp. UHCC 0190 TaxID=3110246 RepID=UPI002B1FAD5B|nr:lipoxygenase family protein [Crocosphaera sp. UHCC 0190]MEA5512164.1 lipoxygenase family protein [Crocosphaera sp. UHCC 0190]